MLKKLIIVLSVVVATVLMATGTVISTGEVTKFKLKRESSVNNKVPNSRVLYSDVELPSNESQPDSSETTVKEPDELRGMWITYYELAGIFDNHKDFRTEFRQMLDKCAEYKFNAIYVHVRSHCDAFYKSEYFPWSSYVQGIKGKQGIDPGVDPLKIMVEEAHSRGIQIHAWINPYRVLTDSQDINELCDSNPAKKWLTDDSTENDTWVVKAGGGLYLNPAIQEVQQLIINGVREVVKNYDVDGIHFDDYFYPTRDESFDAAEYAKYRMAVSSNPLPLDDWRRANVNAMVSGVYSAVKAICKQCVFGISPMASVSNNYATVYADVAAWLKGGWVDYIMPQIYFGFEYPSEKSRFDVLLAEWDKLFEGTQAKLYVGLAAYRIGATDENNVEWSRHSDMLKRQVEHLRTDKQCNGYVMFSYSSFFKDDAQTDTERRNVFETITKSE